MNFVTAALGCLLVFICSIGVLSGAAGAAVGDNDWRPITPEELAMKTPRVEPDADAEIIFEEVRIDDSNEENLTMKHYLRVKIFTDRGREKFSQVDIPFITGKKIKDVGARVIRADGSIVAISDKDIFEREVIRANGVKLRAKSFAVPNIEPGVIVEYRYTEKIEDAGANGMRLYFQRDIPAEIISYYYRPNIGGPPRYQAYNFSDTAFIQDSNGYYLAARRNIPALREEPQMPPDDEVKPWILLQSAGFRSGGLVVRLPDADPDKYWGGVHASNLLLTAYLARPDDEVKKKAAELTSNLSNPEEKLLKLYEFCQTRIKNTSFDTSKTTDDKKKNEIKSLGDVIKYQSAPAPLIDLLFGAMANSLGYGTRLALAANRNQKFFNPEITNDKFIHPAAIAVKIGDEWKFYDPGTPFLPAGSLVWYEEGVWAFLTDNSGYTWRQTPLSGVEKSNAKRNGTFKLDEDGTLEGTVRIEYRGQRAISRRIDGFGDAPAKREEDLRAEIKRQMPGAEVSDIKIEDFDDNTKPLTQSYKLRIPAFAQKTGKRLFFQPSIFEYGGKPLFVSATRTYPVYFQYPWSDDDYITIDLPKGFNLENADAPSDVADSEGIGSIKVNIGIDREHGTLIYRRKFHFGGGGKIIFPSTAYTAVKALFETFRKTDDHLLTLKQN